MPADLDDLLAGLGRAADAIPLAGAEHARQRGRQRTQRRAAISAALAVCLVAAGLGTVLSRPRHDADRTVSPTPSSTALTEVGSPVNTGGPAKSVVQTTRDGKLFSAWTTPGGETYLNAADLHTGAVLWDTALDSRHMVVDVRAAGNVVLVLTESPGGERQAFLVDRANGKGIRSFPAHRKDELILTDKALVHRHAENKIVEVLDVGTGVRRWQTSGPADPDPPVRVLMPDPVKADRLVEVTKAGKMIVHDMRDGRELRTITPVMTPAADSLFVTIGDLVFHDTVPCCDSAAYQIVGTDLDTGESYVLLSDGPERLVGMTACGDDRLCVLDDKPQVTAVDLASSIKLWQSPAPESAATISAIGDSTLVTGRGPAVVLDGGGQPAFRSPDANVDWLDEDTVLVTPRLTAGTVMTVRISDRRLTRLGDIPAPSGACVHTTDRLACPTTTHLRLWSLTG
ncbi:hypothetical protein Ade02nite_07400 [Paractinoplanes deccanensis]|uniref:Pyrrolo-quinoline quinone repeat domain-containing protein n=1 Tax=Paractinoplanes deccanensis TaxID=113561 RepID=A0ABQ3XWH6_9ACTN|nr:PQQ-binding-like beta-propeller repeat protein [Actinoplanes deccanensis]GID72099.1 hypothetical protein Ade02nite_07400 [Actinoplanes deccanensis]